MKRKTVSNAINNQEDEDGYVEMYSINSQKQDKNHVITNGKNHTMHHGMITMPVDKNHKQRKRIS